MTTNKELLERIAQLENIVASLGGRVPGVPRTESIRPEDRPDFVAHGSEQHAARLGLRRAEKEDDLTYEGWTLVDLTAFGTHTRPEMLLVILKQRVNGFLQKPHVHSHAPGMFTPDDYPTSGWM